MPSLRLLLPLSVLLLAGCAGQPGPVVILDDERECAPLDLVQGQELVLSLPSNPTTGFRWEPVALPTQLEAAGDLFEPSQPMGVGSGGTRQLTYKCVAAGDAGLRLHCIQAWEGPTSATQQVSFVLRIADA